MKSGNAKSLKKLVYAACKKIAHPNPQMVYRRVKKAYDETPRNLRSRFNYQTGTVT